jgi:hypothetical protein
MIEEIEKEGFVITPCLVNKELVEKVVKAMGTLETTLVLKSKRKEIKTDKVTLFVGVEWPPDISEIHMRSSGPLGQLSVDFVFCNGKARGEILVIGSDSIWVKGVAAQMKSIIKSARLSYYPIAEYWPIRTALSALLMLFVAWRVSHSFWFVIYRYISLSELSFFVVIFLISFCISVYPLNRFLRWLFPRYSLGHGVQGKIRKLFVAFFVILATWILTDMLFPALF